MFRVLFCATLVATLAANIIFLLATKDKPPDGPATGGTFVTPLHTSAQQKRQAAELNLENQQQRQHKASAWQVRRRDETDAQQQQQRPTTNHKRRRQRRRINRPPVQLAGAEARDGSARPDSRRVRVDAPRDKQMRYEIKSSNRSQDATAHDDNYTSKQQAPIGDNNNNNNKRPVLSIRVKSSKNHVLVSVQGVRVYESGAIESENDTAAVAANENANSSAPLNSAHDELVGRGIHVLALNQFDGSIMSRRVFDTYAPQQDAEMLLYLNMLQDGRVLVFAVQDEASFGLASSSPLRRALKRWGSKYIDELSWRDMWALVLVKETRSEMMTSGSLAVLPDERATNLAEAITKSARFSAWAPALLIEARVQLASGPPPECKFNDNKHDDDDDDRATREARRSFCARVDGYGQVCDCKHPAPIGRPTGRPIANTQLARVPIIVMASNRPYYLFRSLKSLLRADGVDKSLVTVFIDGPHDEPAQVCHLFQVRHVHMEPRGTRSARISHHYKASLTLAFERLHPNAQHAIIFEEDLDIARDALVYFNQTLDVLKRDPTLYCVSAWNDQAYEHSAHDLRRVYRVETMPGLGWLLSRELFERELRASWPPESQQHDWDMWLRTNSVRRGRECLVPDVPRTYHFGAVGTNINSYFQRQYFAKHAFSDNYAQGRPLLQLRSLDELDALSYERQIKQIITNPSTSVLSFASSIQHQHHETTTARNKSADLEFVCAMRNKLTSGARNDDDANENEIEDEKTTVIFIKMIDQSNFDNWLKLAKCWQLWDLDARGQHKSMWRLHLGAHQVLVVGVPASPYSRLLDASRVQAFDF